MQISIGCNSFGAGARVIGAGLCAIVSLDVNLGVLFVMSRNPVAALLFVFEPTFSLAGTRLRRRVDIVSN